MRTAKVILVNLGMVSGLLLCLEVASRSLLPTSLPDPLVTTKRDDWKGTREFDPLLFWRMRPNTVIDGDRYTNDLGLRGPEVPAKAPNEFRILSLGESTTFAPSLPNSASYSALVEHQLGEMSSHQIRVINAGVPGYTLFQGYTYLQYRGLALQPDAVMIYFGYNDFLPIAFRSKRDALSARDREALSDRQLFERRSRLTQQVGLWLLERSNLSRTLAFRAHKNVETLPITSQRVRVPDSDRRWLLKQFLKLSTSHRFDLIVIVPWYLEFEEHVPLLREFGASMNRVILIDLPQKLAKLPGDRRAYFQDQLHPNRLGHQLIADEIVATLSRLDL